MTHIHSELIKKWADGAIIQRGICGDWTDVKTPLWETNVVFRVKPDINKDFKNILDELIVAAVTYDNGHCTGEWVDLKMTAALDFFKENTK
jgi:hypothetical protein